MQGNLLGLEDTQITEQSCSRYEHACHERRHGGNGITEEEISPNPQEKGMLS